MDLIALLPAFVVAVILISASPGPAMALVLRRAALRGVRGTTPTVLGLGTGLYAWALLAAAGFAALVAASEVAFLALRVIGTVVLIALGIRAWRAAWCRRGQTGAGMAAEADSSTDARTRWAAFGEGALVQLANPKAAAFMIAFYPQFVPADRPLFATTAVLALVQVALEATCYLVLAAGVARARGWFSRPRIRRRLEVVTGCVLVGLGLRVAVSSR